MEWPVRARRSRRLMEKTHLSLCSIREAAAAAGGLMDRTVLGTADSHFNALPLCLTKWWYFSGELSRQQPVLSSPSVWPLRRVCEPAVWPSLSQPEPSLWPSGPRRRRPDGGSLSAPLCGIIGATGGNARALTR